jgi:hypothetical protein
MSEALWLIGRVRLTGSTHRRVQRQSFIGQTDALDEFDLR